MWLSGRCYTLESFKSSPLTAHSWQTKCFESSHTGSAGANGVRTAGMLTQSRLATHPSAPSARIPRVYTLLLELCHPQSSSFLPLPPFLPFLFFLRGLSPSAALAAASASARSRSSLALASSPSTSSCRGEERVSRGVRVRGGGQPGAKQSTGSRAKRMHAAPSPPAQLPQIRLNPMRQVCQPGDSKLAAGMPPWEASPTQWPPTG